MKGVAVALTLLPGCFGMPTPLAPGIGGSVGLPHNGVLSRGAALEQQGTGYERLRRDEIRWGNPRLVAAIERASAEVAALRPDGPPLVVGDLSAQYGGEIPNHRSHRTGRDADLLLFALSSRGLPVSSPGFVRFGQDGLAATERSRHVRLDVERNWLLVKALSSDDQVQWLFVARWVETQLIEYALARGETDDVVARASLLLRQPGDSFPHDDHLHLRIGCSADDEVAGCTGGAQRWPWYGPSHQLSVSDEEMLLALFDDEAGDPPLTGDAEAQSR